MAVYQIETGVAHGRGFIGADPEGYLAKLYTWITGNPATSAGPGWTIIDDQSTSASNPYIVISDQAAPDTNDVAKIIKVTLPTLEAGYVHVHYYMSFTQSDSSLHGLYAGYRMATLDDADFVYDFRGGDETMLFQSRIGTDWDVIGITEFDGDANLVEGTEVSGTLISAAGIGSTAIYLTSADAAKFTESNYYYVYDFNPDYGTSGRLDYIKCESINVSAGIMTIDSLSANFASSGAKITAYDHRFITFSNNPWINTAQFSMRYSTLPYNSLTHAYQTFNSNRPYYFNYAAYIYAGCGIVLANEYIETMDPNDIGLYAVQRPSVAEYYNNKSGYPLYFDDMNRGYGTLKNVYATSLGSMARGQDGRIIGGENYLYFQKSSEIFTDGGSASIAILFLDSESIT